MIYMPEEMQVETRQPDSFGGKLFLCHMMPKEERPANQRLYAVATLEPNTTLHYHMHSGESESYYFLSGKGIYNDNGKEIEIKPGMYTYTPSGTGHGLVNTGTEPIVFIASIVKD
ncbi:MAG: cupin domain-containing protein [Clostridia bacterium]|nr:cupin domain-containing protein [Clostridia bacterium]MBQ3553765.1 cupin domain-containing protein [Clostridia bacterium]